MNTSTPTRHRPTPGLILGPFYPVQQAVDADHRLWRGDALPAGARRLRLEGRVLTVDGDAVTGARVELWHADHLGRYPHPSAADHASVDPRFTAYGCTGTDAVGGFAFDSLVPGAYAGPDVRRARHLHLQVTGRLDRLVTQLFLPDDPGREADHWYRAAARPEMLVATRLASDADHLHLQWTALLNRG